MINRVGDYFASEYAIDSEQVGADNLELILENVPNIVALTKAEKYLSSLPPVTDVQLMKVSKQQAQFYLNLSGEGLDVVRALALLPEFEKITDQIIEEFKSTNPEAFKEWDELEINGKIVDVEIITQKEPIEMDGGGITTEGIGVSSGKMGYITKIGLQLKIQTKDGVLQKREMRYVLLHGLGHFKGAKKAGDVKEEDAADRYGESVIKKEK